MATSFREFPWYLQVLVFLALALAIILAGEYTPYSPVRGVRADLDQAKGEEARLNQEVTQLQVYDRRLSEMRAEMDALQKQLETLKTIVPDEKEVDEFIRLVQGAATESGVQIRRLAAQSVQAREYHYELPFDFQVDGPYYNVLEFFGRIGRLSRTINIGDLSFTGVEEGRAPRFPMRPGTTVTGSFSATTFFSKPGDEGASKAPAKGKAPGKPGKG